MPGLYELSYRYRDTTIIATRPLTVTEAEVGLTAPDSAPIGTTIDVGWTGPNAPYDNVELGRAGEPGYIDFAYVTDGNPVQIIMPPEPGLYELRYRFRDSETIATRAIEAVAAEVSLSAPDAGPIGSTIEVTWTGPAAENDNIELGRVGEPGYLDYAYVRDGNPVQIILPAEPGTYELRYRFRDSETIATRAIQVTAADVSLTAPDIAPAGSTVDVVWTGPNAEGDNIQVALPGGTYLDYAYTNSGNPVQITLPPAPGIYELRYSFRDTEIILTRPIETTAVTAQVLSQPSAVAGEPVTVGWDGPNYATDYVTISKRGEPGYDTYAYTTSGNPLTLTAPAEPGDYEVRYIMGETVIATAPLVVTAP